MGIATSGTLAILAIFMTFQIVYFGIEFSFHLFSPKKMTQRWFVLFQYLIAPVSIGIFGLILIPNIFSIDKKSDGDVFAFNTTSNHTCQADIDADIGGYGIRIAIWAQGFVIFFIALAGTFHSKVTGAKEIGAGLIITHFSLAVALMVQLNQTKKQNHETHSILTSASAILGAMILDSQNSALSILLITKETLASRWQVGIVIFCQAMSLVLIPILVKGFLRELPNPLANDGCNHIQVFWWGRLRSFPYDDDVKCDEPIAFWIYYTFRCILYIQSSFHALMNTQIFHEAKKDPACILKGITHPSLGKDADRAWNRSWRGRLRAWLGAHSQDVKFGPYPTTVSLMYIVYGLLMVTAMAAAEMTISGKNAIFEEEEKEDDQVLSTGQIIAIVVAAVTIARGLWLFFTLFIKDGNIKKITQGLDSFRWPLHFGFDN
ncbi:hypothetical protein BDP81DRAFT_440157 [Colletotrichum phormii]|uniref:Uncharacterized protein n=1 Tax=Colletotrichum phormii TaxID=359342 RepID=A0AAI9ZGC2_9PEZI|nr:uncharacterized protein BDP81DRAFT_440157 [Colletotrichum phormii]KAK1623080.1 hypothetical protein BDP81DRAFT_440157 [Colletotrichum phormii]